MTTWIKKGLLLSLCMIMTACVSEMGLREEFDKSMKAYNRMLRWQEYENAGMLYQERELRDEYMKRVEVIKKRGVTLADFRIITSECLAEKKTGEVIAEFDYYVLPSNRVKTITYRQQWIYQESEKSWKLKSPLPLFD